MGFRQRLSGLLGKQKLDAELEEELRSHIEMRTEELIASGVPADEARRRAVVAFGNKTYLQEEARSFDTVQWLETLGQDVRHAFRLLGRDTRFSLAAIVTLALGIGATAAAFSVVYCVLLRPLPYPESQRLVTLWERNPAKGVVHGDASAGNFYDWEKQNSSFSALAAFSVWPLNLTGTAMPEHLEGALVSPAFFSVMAARPLQGRGFRPNEDQGKESDVAVVSASLWNRLFQEGTRLNGQTVTLNGSRMTIVGVMPNDFEYPNKDVEVWVPLALSAQNRQNREGRWLKVIGRLKPDTTMERAQQDLSIIAHRLAKDYPKENEGRDIQLIPLRQEQVGNLKVRMAVLLAAVSLLLFIACSNVGSLLLARALGRSGEIAVRLAIGANRGRIVRQLLTESLVLAFVAGAAGMSVAYGLIRASRSLIPATVPGVQHLGINGYVLGFCLGISLVTVFLFGSVPALRGSRIALVAALQSAGGTRMSGKGTGRQILVAAQIAISVILLVGAGLLTRSFTKLLSVDPGFDAHDALTMRLSLPRARYSTNQQQIDFFQQVLERLRSLPGVEHAGAVSDPPLQKNSMTFKVLLDASSNTSGPASVGVRWVTGDYFEAMKIGLQQGRFLKREDNAAAPPVAVVNRAMARRFWRDGNGVGSRVRLEEEPRWFEIVGIVDDVRQIGLDEAEVPAVYLSHAQKSQAWMNWMTVVVRTSIEPTSQLGAIRREIWSVDKDQPIAQVETLDEVRSKSMSLPRFSSTFATGFSLLAVFITMVGIYGVVSYAVGQKLHEIGIRIALGAAPSNIVRLVIGRTVKLAGIGIASGLASAWLLSRFLKTLLFDVSTTDPVIFALSVLFLAMVVVAACFAPVRRALRVDPIRILRYE